MSSGKFRVDTKQIQRILTETIITLCKSTLDYDMELSIKGILGITLDQEDILLVDIKEIIKGEQILCKKAIPDSSLFPFIPDKWPTSTSTPLTYPLEPSEPSLKRHRPNNNDSPALNLSQSDMNASSGTSTPVEKPPQTHTPVAIRPQPSGQSRSRRVKREPMKVIVIEDKDVLMNHSDDMSPGSGGMLDPSTAYTILGVPTRLSTPSNAALSGRGMTLPTRVLGTAYETPVSAVTKSSPFPIAMATSSKPKKMPALEVISPGNKKEVTPLRKIAIKSSPNRSRGSSGKKERPEKKHKCPNCCFSSDRRFNLERHMRQHTGGGVVCCHCGRSFCDDYYLKNNHLPKCPANPELDGSASRKEPVDLSMSDVSLVGLNVTPLQIVSVESMADTSNRGNDSDGNLDDHITNDDEEEEEEEGPDPPEMETTRPTRRDSTRHDSGRQNTSSEGMDTSPSRNLRKRSNPTQNISELTGKEDNPDAMNNNDSAAEALFDPSLKIKDEPIDT